MSTHHAQALSSAAGDASASLNRLLFRKLLPLLIAAYVISFLDRTNIAFAKHSMGSISAFRRPRTDSARGCSS